MASNTFQRVRFGWACAVAAVAVALAGCGSSSSSSHTTAAASASTPSASTPPSWAQTFATYTGGKLGAANFHLTPIDMGWVNDDGGSVQSPETTTAAEIAVKVINNYLGGIDGHPLQLVRCSVVTGEEQGQTCAQQFLADPKVHFITEGVMSVGAGDFHQTLDGKKPVIGFNPVRIEEATGKNTYEMGGGSFAGAPGFAAYATDVLHAKTVSLLYPDDDPAGIQSAKNFDAASVHAGLKVTEVGFPSAVSDLVPELTAARSESTDVTMMLLISTSQCTAAARATQELQIKHPVSLSLCLIPQVRSSLGDFPKWAYVFPNVNAEAPGSNPYVAPWLAAMKQYGASNTSPFPQLAFGTILTEAKLLNQIGKGANFTPAELVSAIKRFPGPAMFGPPGLHYGFDPSLPAIGALAVRVYTYEGGGKWVDATGGQWLR